MIEEKFPWKTDKWHVSPYNFHNRVQSSFQTPPNIEIHDTTLRDGEEASGVMFTKKGKILIADALDEIGIDRIEAAINISPNDPESLKALMDAGLGDKLFTMCRVEQKNYLDLARKLDISHISLNTPVSNDLVLSGLGKSMAFVKEESIDGITYAKEHGFYVNFFPYDTFKADWHYLRDLLTASIEEGHADSITLVDTTGVAIPWSVAYLVKRVKSLINVPVEIHCHNDFGLAVANTLAAYTAGAQVIHTSVNGLGMRAGNTPLEEMVMCLKCLLGINVEINFKKIPYLSKLVREQSGVQISEFKPIVGENVFSFENMGLLKTLEKNNSRKTFLPFEPKFIEREIKVVISKWSDIEALNSKLKQFDINIDDDDKPRILEKIKQDSIKKKKLSDDDLKTIINDSS